MRYKTFSPSSKLMPYVRNYWLLEVDKSDCPVIQNILPFGSFELIIHLKNVCEMTSFANSCKSFMQPQFFYTGQFTKPISINFQNEAKVLAASLHPWAGNLLFKIPADKFTNETISVDLFEKNISFTERLLNSKKDSELIFLLEQFLQLKLMHYIPDKIVSRIVKEIKMENSTKKLNKLLNESGLSRRRIEQKFLETTGLTMSHLLRKIRFQKAVQFLRNFPLKSLTQIGLDAGYYDQAHFIRDFKDFSNLSPREYLIQEFGMKKFVEGLMLVD
ncbi:MAG: DUF6597 domain-containing transcriptional factor [Ignavibacteria bacterium]